MDGSGDQISLAMGPNLVIAQSEQSMLLRLFHFHAQQEHCFEWEN